MRIHDGAYGTLLQGHLHGDETVDDLCVRAPHLVRQAHCAYLESGATAIQSNSFLAHLRGSDLRRRTLYLAALECAREAAADIGGDVLVVATIGPIGTEPRGYWRDLELLLEADVQAVLCETVTDRRVADAFLAAWAEVAGGVHDVQPLLGCSVSPSRGMDGMRWVLELASEAPAGVELGLNCCEGPTGLRDLLEELVGLRGQAWTMPSAGVPSTVAGAPEWPLSDPAAWAGAVRELVDGLGTTAVSAVGGCCGTTPDSIAALGAA